ncbi:MAG: hypothetical protein AAGN35_08970 [Bacteroidota bacterium]
MSESTDLKSAPVSLRPFWIGSAILLLPFLLGSFRPDPWWAVHFLSFLSPLTQTIIWGLTGLLFLTAYLPAGRNFLPRLLATWSGKPAARWVPLAVATAFSLVCFAYPLPFDFYGDAPTILASFDAPEKNVDHWRILFSPDIFHPRAGERTVLNLVAIVHGALGGDFRQAFALLGALSGGLYLFIALRMAWKMLATPAPRGVAFAAIVGTPAALVFLGHIEVYAPLWPVLAGFAALLLRYTAHPQRNSWLLMLPLIFVALKLHLSSVLLLPVWLLAGLHFFQRKRPGFQKRSNWKWLGLAVLLPLFLAALVVYFGVLGDHADPRFLDADTSSYERLFLPLVSPAPPLDRYNLLGGYHLLDFFNLLLLWSPVGLLVLGMGLTAFRRQVNWNAPEHLLLGTGLILYTGLFFLINPLLSMPMDWDLMAIPAPWLAIWAVVILRDTEKGGTWTPLVGPALGALLLVLGVFAVHWQTQAHSERLQSIGRHVFRSYWIRSTGNIQAGLNLIAEDSARYVDRYRANIEALRPDALLEVDEEYAILLARLGKFYRTRRNIGEAEKYHLDAFSYFPDQGGNLIGLMECAYFKGDFSTGMIHARRLVELQYPTRQKSLAIGVEIALRANNWPVAADWTAAYRAQWPDDPAYQYIEESLASDSGRVELTKVYGR